MHNYESLFILNPELDETAMDNLIDFIQKSMEKSGKVKEVNRWGLKRLAYPIKKHDNGFYVLFEYESKPEVISKLKEEWKIKDGIIRFNVIRKK
ncbi:30S ribosomal protein S6 [candidate division WOR-3 bacterium]|nr:30S ribosomal protein S6 [candidate division WOR-3 bacterium]